MTFGLHRGLLFHLRSKVRLTLIITAIHAAAAELIVRAHSGYRRPYAAAYHSGASEGCAASRWSPSSAVSPWSSMPACARASENVVSLISCPPSKCLESFAKLRVARVHVVLENLSPSV